MAVILDGKTLASTIRTKIRERVTTLPSQPGLAVLLIGDDPASHTYVHLKQEACIEAGIHFELFRYHKKVSETELIQTIHKLNHRTDINGILVQLPLPGQKTDEIISEINPLKDVDGFHKENIESLRKGTPCIVSAVALGVMRLIREAIGTDPLPPTATIISSPFFSVPLDLLLNEQGVTVTVTQAEDPDLIQKTKTADILIVAEGIPNLITAEYVKPNAIVIDVGTTKVEGTLQGDVDFPAVEPIAKAITPVPGGVGPMTVAMLLVNILKAYQLQH
jgi:methylenetetrahydrofolate dehydrogenase (NADP+) / methenyltetrahydrofolate cyclohydrolase